MGKGLIISNHTLLSDIYSLNLKFYTDSHVIIRKTVDEGLKHLKEPGVRLDFILLIQTVEDKKALSDFCQFFKNNKVNSSLLVCGPVDPIPGNILFISSAFDIKTMIKTVARLLDITAKKMVEVSVPDYIPFATRLLEHLSKTPVPLHLKNGEQYKIEWKAEEEILADKVSKLMTDGTEDIYIQAPHRLRFLNALSSALLIRLSKEKMNPEEALGFSEKGMEVVASQLFNQNSVNEVKELAAICVEHLDKTIKEIPNIEKLIRMLINSNSNYAFMHSVLTAYVAKKVIENLSWGSKEQAEKVGFVLFYHDIYLVPFFNEYPECVGEKDLLMHPGLNDQEKDIILKHALMAAELLRQMKQIPIGADSIVMQHHGTTNGIGFPVECKDDISPLAKVILIAEDYVNYFLINMNSMNQSKASPEVFFAEIHQRYPKTTYKKIINTLQTLSF